MSDAVPRARSQAFRFDAGATSVSTSPQDCAALAKRVADFEAKQAAEVERTKKQNKDMSKALK